MAYDEIYVLFIMHQVFMFLETFLRSIYICSTEERNSKEFLILSLNKPERVHFKERMYLYISQVTMALWVVQTFFHGTSKAFDFVK